MLIRFVVSNFLSFDSEKEFNMIAGSAKEHPHHISQKNQLNILKTSAIYGANGAGKSNLIKAIDFFQNLIEEGKLSKSINSQKFKLNKENAKKPTNFEIEFAYKKKIYAYGIQINANIIENEWLYITHVNKDDELIFERTTDKKGHSKINLSKKYLKTEKDKLLIEIIENNLLKKNELFLNKYEELKITDISNVKSWFTDNLAIIYPESTANLLALIFNVKDFSLFTNELLKTFDTGIERLEVKTMDFNLFFKDNKEQKNEIIEQFEIENSPFVFFPTHENNVFIIKENKKPVVKKIVAIHQNKNIHFNLLEESDGTQRLIDFIPMVYNLFNDERTFIIDEIDQSLHPSLLYTLIEKISQHKDIKGQLIFSTHQSNLLSFNFFRKDEIWFAEKNNTGATDLYSLNDYNILDDLDIEKGYLQGRFGAIPFTNHLKNLNWTKDNA